MSFFNRKSKEEREQEKKKILQEEYGLKDIDSIDIKRLDTMIDSKRGVKALGLTSKTDTAIIEAYLKTIEEQNWMIIRLLEEIKNNQ